MPPGQLTKRDVHSLLPFTDVVLKLELRGRDLRVALEHGLAQTDREGGGFLQVSGVRVVWDPRRAAGGRVVSVAVAGRALGDDTVYSVAVPSYLVRGGDGYAAFARGKVLVDESSGPQVAQIVMDAIVARGAIAPATDGRIATTAR